jgi:hypothetical protein
MINIRVPFVVVNNLRVPELIVCPAYIVAIYEVH